MTRNLYPLTFETLIRPYPYGARHIAEHFQRELPPGIVAETWELSDHPGNPGVVSNGPLAGTTLHDLIAELGADLLGEKVAPAFGGRFPLLLKFLDVAHYLGVQLHPDDAACARLGFNDSGKSEAWYIVWAAPGATAYWGLKPGLGKADMGAAIARLAIDEPERRARMTPADRDAAMAADPTMAVLRPVPLHSGDMLYVPPGWVHACGPGVIIFEIQQNADVTLGPRGVFAGGQRRDDLAGDRATELFLELLTLGDVAPGQEAIPPVSVADGGTAPGKNERRYLLASRYFALEEWRLGEPWPAPAHPDKFVAFTALEGHGVIEHSGGQVDYAAGRTVMIPAGMGQYRLVPAQPSRLMRSYVPDLRSDIIEPLRRAGVAASAIAALGGPAVANDLLPLLG